MVCDMKSTLRRLILGFILILTVAIILATFSGYGISVFIGRGASCTSIMIGDKYFCVIYRRARRELSPREVIVNAGYEPKSLWTKYVSGTDSEVEWIHSFAGFCIAGCDRSEVERIVMARLLWFLPLLLIFLKITNIQFGPARSAKVTKKQTIVEDAVMI